MSLTNPQVMKLYTECHQCGKIIFLCEKPKSTPIWMWSFLLESPKIHEGNLSEGPMDTKLYTVCDDCGEIIWLISDKDIFHYLYNYESGIWVKTAGLGCS
jgi:hypothetical protein